MLLVRNRSCLATGFMGRSGITMALTPEKETTMRTTISLRTGFWAVVWGFSQLFPMVLTTGRAEEPTQSPDRIVLTETYNAVTNIYFTNVAKHSGSPNPNVAKRRFRVDLNYWLMAPQY